MTRLVLVLVLASVVTPRAHAQEDARAIFRRGVAALRDGRYEDAERAFVASYRADPRPATMCNLALTYDEQHETREAAEAYERCAATDEEGRFRAHAQERALALREELAREAALPVPPEPEVEPTEPEATPSASPFVEAPTTTNVPIVEHGAPTEAPSRSHTLAIVGGSVAALGAGAAALGAVFAGRSQDGLDTLDARHGSEGTVVLAEGSEDAALLQDARRDRRIAIGAYASGAVLGALGVTLIVLDLLQPSGTAVAAAPLPGGAMVTARVALR
ncbi:MAG: hypothetical protein H6721_13055 [Sandaracinus sp.]|nr:hypothetical protein [Sandaracinus sp.]